MVEKRIDLSKYNVLVAEDDFATFYLLRLQFEDSGLKIIHAKDGEEALNLYHKNKDCLNLIMLDARMPILDGFETAIAIRELDEIIPLVLVTSFSIDEIAGYKNTQIFNEIIVKPITVKQIASLLVR